LREIDRSRLFRAIRNLDQQIGMACAVERTPAGEVASGETFPRRPPGAFARGTKQPFPVFSHGDSP